MPRRNPRIIYTSSSSEDEDNEAQPPPLHQQENQNPNFSQPQQQEDELFDEDIEFEQPEMPNIGTVTLNSENPNPSPPPAVISDEDFVDVSDYLSPPSPPPPPPPPPPRQQPIPATTFVRSDCQVNDCLRKLGLCLRRDWLDSCKLGLQSTAPGFSNFDVETKAKLCFGQFLISDMNFVGAGVLPDNVCDLHLVELAGPFVLQVDEVINISCSLKERYKNASHGIKRCLKLSMTDGVQRVFGMEYMPIPSKFLEGLGPAGFKVVIRNVTVRRGLLMLVPEVLEILGGYAEELEEARRRLIHEVQKPPRGKRSRAGVVPPLSMRATLAAWPQNGVNTESVPLSVTNQAPGNSTNSTFHGTAQFHSNVQGAGVINRDNHVHATGRETTEVTTVMPTHQRLTSGGYAQHFTSREHTQRSSCVDPVELPASREVTDPPPGTESSTGNSFLSPVVGNDDAHMADQVMLTHQRLTSGGYAQHFTSREDAQRSSSVEPVVLPASREDTEPPPGTESSNGNILLSPVVGNEDAHMADQVMLTHQRLTSGGYAQHCTSREDAQRSSSVEPVVLPASREVTEPPPGTESSTGNILLSPVVDNEHAHMADQVEHSVILSEEKELPFTYLASLSAKWDAVQEKETFVKGKIKCFLTGVKAFRYRERSTYELQVYIDDGSLISEILIHHNVVQKQIVYSPEELSAALSSSDQQIATGMKNTMKKFENFLSQFEGIMIVEINKDSTLPVALDMNQGCTASDAWLLLQRLNSLSSDQLRQDNQSDVITLSP